MLFKAEAIKKIGGFDEKYFMYGEDVDLCLAVKKNGWSMMFIKDAQVMHCAGQSSKTLSYQMELASVKSGCLYFRKNYSRRKELLFRALLVPLYIFKILPHAILWCDKAHRLRMGSFWNIVKFASCNSEDATQNKAN